MAIVHLMKMGTLVFKTLHDTGCVDFVPIDKHGEIHLYDVKTVSIRQSGKRKGHHISRLRTPLQRKLKVNLIYVDLEKPDVWIANHG